MGYKILYQTLWSTNEGKKVVEEHYSPATFTKERIQYSKKLNKQIGYRWIGRTRHNGKYYHTWERYSHTESSKEGRDVYYRIMYIKVK